MLVWRTVATTRGAAFLTSAQMHPLRTDLHTLLANPLLRLLDLINRIDMSTYFCCHPASIQAGRYNQLVVCDRKTQNRYPMADPSSSKVRRSYHRRESHQSRQCKTI